MGRINIELEVELHKKLKVICALQDKTIQEYINEILKDKIKRDKNVK